MSRSVDQFQTIRTQGAILPADLLQRIAAGDAPGLDPQTYHLPGGVKLKEAISQSWTRLSKHWKDFVAARKLILDSDETGGVTTREKWLLPLLQELGYGRLTTTKSPEIDGKVYAIDRFWTHVPIHLIGCKLSLDHRTKGARGAATAIPHSMVQEFLNRSTGHLWAFLSNGLQFRILRDNAALSRQSFVEFDLESMMQGEVYADFALFWLLCHQSRLESDRPTDCWLETWSKQAQEQGTRMLRDLRTGVKAAIEALGRGFLAHPRNAHLVARLQSGELPRQDYYRQLLRIVYRLLFLCVAEDRGLLHPPPPADPAGREAYDRAVQTYDAHYSVRRLRDLAEGYRGSKHADLWHGLSLVVSALGSDAGCPALALPALGSFLWSADSTPDLAGPLPGSAPASAAEKTPPVYIRNEDLLDAIRALAFVEKGRVLRAVDYRNLGSEELGSIYESLLELHPQINASARTFALADAAGNERKETGSYYTPDSLVQCLLDSALEPVVADAIAGQRGPDAGSAILQLKVCDPACGSGHFLIAAAHRLARHLARARTGETEPGPADYQHALRDVIGHCIYGVDINPMAVELCKVSLWMEALEPGRPLSFLDHRIQCGNSLIGATPALLARGIPDEAFDPIEGDDKTLCKAAKRQNKDERKRDQLHLSDEYDRQNQRPWEHLGSLATAITQLDAVDDATIDGVRLKQRTYGELVASGAYESGRFLADAWCAAFVWKKTREFDYPITQNVFVRIDKNPRDVQPWMRQEIHRLARQYQFFHWHLAFPDVFVPRPVNPEDETDITGWSGGFDCVLGNPPWERIKLQEKEWFAERVPEIAEAPNAAHRRRLIQQLERNQDSVYVEYRRAQRSADGESHIIRDCGRYPLCGIGETNTYKIFAEAAYRLLSTSGFFGMVLPTSLITHDNTKLFFAELMTTKRLVASIGFDNEEKRIFPDIDNNLTFAAVIVSWRAVEQPQFCFNVRRFEQLTERDRFFTLTKDDLSLLAPNTRTCPLFRSTRDAEITKRIYRRFPILLREGEPSQSAWAVSFLRMFDMALDSHHFVERDRMGEIGATPDGNQFIVDGERLLPLYEAKMIWQFEHRWATDYGSIQTGLPSRKYVGWYGVRYNDPSDLARGRYWVSETLVRTRISSSCRYFVLYRSITNRDLERTSVFAITPAYAVGSTSPVLQFAGISALEMANFVADRNSFACDFVTRNVQPGSDLKYFTVKQLPAPTPDDFRIAAPWGSELLRDWISRRSLELTYTAWDLTPFAADCGYSGPPFIWDEERRFQIRCELDAAFFHIYGINRDDAAYILETFPIVKRKDIDKHGHYRTKDTILEIYDALATAAQSGTTYQTRLTPPPGPPADPAGNFIPLPEWKPGHPRPANWPPHIHPPKEISRS